MRTVSGDQNRAEWRLKNWGVRMPCLLWTADKDRAARHEPVRLKSMNYLHLACISVGWIRIYVVFCFYVCPRPAIYRSGFKCSKCNKSFISKDVFLDLTVTSGMKEYSELKPARTELFRSPLVSFLYERGWRQNFNRSGFPGRDEEVHFLAASFFNSMALSCYCSVRNYLY